VAIWTGNVVIEYERRMKIKWKAVDIAFCITFVLHWVIICLRYHQFINVTGLTVKSKEIVVDCIYQSYYSLYVYLPELLLAVYLPELLLAVYLPEWLLAVYLPVTTRCVFTRVNTFCVFTRFTTRCVFTRVHTRCVFTSYYSLCIYKSDYLLCIYQLLLDGVYNYYSVIILFKIINKRVK